MSKTTKPQRKRVSPAEAIEFYRLFEKYGSYAEVARITGRSASTIGRYISGKGIPNALQHAIDQTIAK